MENSFGILLRKLENNQIIMHFTLTFLYIIATNKSLFIDGLKYVGVLQFLFQVRPWLAESSVIVQCMHC